MKIERIDERTVKCFLTNEELDEYDITYKDFVVRSDKARVVVEEIIEQAEEEVGYQAPAFAFDLQVMLLPDKGMVLTFSEKEPEEGGVKEEFMECLKEMKQALLDTKKKLEKPGTVTVETGDPGQDEAAAQEEKESHPMTRAVFAFYDMHHLLNYAKSLPKNLRVKSALYQMGGLYYLYLEKGGAAYERYSRACVQAVEFSRLYTAEENRMLHLEEHAELLIAEQALKKLRLGC